MKDNDEDLSCAIPLDRKEVGDCVKEPRFIFQRGSVRKEADSSDVRCIVQDILSRSLNLATLVGSGASTPAIPLMGLTFSKIRENLARDDQNLSILLEDRISKLAKYQNTDPENFRDIEGLLSWLNQRIEGCLGSEKDDKAVSDVIRKEFLSSVNVDYNSIGSSRVLEDYRKVVQGLGISRQLLARNRQTVFDVVNLFTTNYDLFHELALETSGYAYADGFSNGILASFSPREYHRRPIDLDERFRDHYEPVNPFFRLYKLHGSINWRMFDDRVVRIPRVPGSEMSYPGADQLIAPMSSKYALTQGSPYSDIFREFVNAMAIPNTVLFTCGFSFADLHIANLIEQALARPDFTLVALIGNPEKMDESSPTRKFYDSVSSANTYFIYPAENDPDPNRPLYFSEFAEFVGPEIAFGGPSLNQEQDTGDGDE